MSSAWKLLAVGISVKRWLVLLVLGMLLMSLGVALTLVESAQAGLGPTWLSGLTRGFLPQLVTAALFMFVGALAVWAALSGLYRSISTAMPAQTAGSPSLIEALYESHVRRGGPRVTCVGGGTGMPTALRGLKSHTAHITAIVTVGDDGGSSGRLRREHGILPPGDFRNNIVALAEVEPLMERLFQYRFPQGSSLEGHSFGNLFVLAMTGVTGNFEQALRETSRVLAVQGTILPSTLEDVQVCARFVDGTQVAGESQIPEVGKPIDRLSLVPEHPSAHPEAVRAILDADIVVLGPGSLYTSVLPNLLVEGVAKALQQSSAMRVYVCNVATQPGETDGYDVEAHVEALLKHLPGTSRAVDFVIANRHADGTPPRKVQLVRPSGRLQGPNVPRILEMDVAREDLPLRHDAEKLGLAVVQLYEEWRRNRE